MMLGFSAAFIAYRCLSCFQGVAVAQVVSPVVEEVEGVHFHYVKAHVLDRLLWPVGLPGVKLVEDRARIDFDEGARVRR